MEKLERLALSRLGVLRDKLATLPSRRAVLRWILRRYEELWLKALLTEDSLSDDDRDCLDTWSIGLGLLVNELITREVEEEGTPLNPADHAEIAISDRLLWESGWIQGTLFLLECSHRDFFRFSRESESVVQFRANFNTTGPELFAQLQFRHRAPTPQNPYKDLLVALNEAETDVDQLAFDHVRPWLNHYIEYDAHPHIDAYFDAYAKFKEHQFNGADSFPDDTEFGSIPFSTYRKLATALISLAYKHLRFCLALTRKHPEIIMINISTIHQTYDQLVDNFAPWIEENDETTRHLLEFFTLTLENKKHHLDSYDSLFCPLIQIGNGNVLKPIFTTLSNPYAFMLKELRRRYPTDWDRAISRREEIFREEVYDLFRGNRFVTIDRPVLVRTNGRVVTDIDAVVYDVLSHTIALIQLKWQDLYDRSPRMRESRRTNLSKQGNAWVEATSYWLRQVTPREWSSILGLPLRMCKKIKSRRIFVITKYRSHFNVSEQRDDRAAWCSISQLDRIRREVGNGHPDPIGAIWSTAREESALRSLGVRYPDKTLYLPNTTIRVFGDFERTNDVG